MYSGKLIGPLGFSRQGVYVGERGLSEVEPRGLTRARRGQGVAAPPLCVGATWPPSVRSSDVWELPGEI